MSIQLLVQALLVRLNRYILTQQTSYLLFTLGMPYAFRQAGVVLGTFILIFIAIITDYSLILMVRGGELSGTNSYQVSTTVNIQQKV